MHTGTAAMTAADVRHYHDQGWVLLRGFRDDESVQTRIQHYMRLRAAGSHPGDMGGNKDAPEDPLNRYPRMINMHDWDSASARWAAAADLRAAIAAVLDDEPVLRQTMLYFKPPQARGQGLHQDEQYITTTPLVGAWLALDRCDAANGCMQVVSGSHRLGHLAVEAADPALSFVDGQTVLPEGATPEDMCMQAGDLLLFDGRTVHGSLPNRTTDRFRRSLIYHFIGTRSRDFEAPSGTTMRDLRRQRTETGR